ncbi:MAG: helix-turn-helix transcriptional regulator [Clostridia bacterium]|nr:helix-turn-helix transcriptional regulator [Clostridia bacterium]
MTLEARLNQIIAEQKITKREFARRVGISENYLYILTSNSRPGTNRNKTISATLAKLIAVEFGYDADWILNGDTAK